METRKIELTIEQAIEWWLGDNETLRQLALSTYTEEELKDEFYSSIGIKSDTITVDMLTFSSFSRLKAIACYFNEGWIKEKHSNRYRLIIEVNGLSIKVKEGSLFTDDIKYYTFADGTPFGIKIEK